LRSGEGFIERGFGMGVEVVLHQDDGLGVGEVDIGKVRKRTGVIDGGAALGDLDVAPAFQASSRQTKGRAGSCGRV
jgi:hypothetical protein